MDQSKSSNLPSSRVSNNGLLDLGQKVEEIEEDNFKLSPHKTTSEIIFNPETNEIKKDKRY
jgi:hypothetical protein